MNVYNSWEKCPFTTGSNLINPNNLYMLFTSSTLVMPTSPRDSQQSPLLVIKWAAVTCSGQTGVVSPHFPTLFFGEANSTTKRQQLILSLGFTPFNGTIDLAWRFPFYVWHSRCFAHYIIMEHVFIYCESWSQGNFIFFRVAGSTTNRIMGLVGL